MYKQLQIPVLSRCLEGCSPGAAGDGALCAGRKELTKYRQYKTSQQGLPLYRGNKRIVQTSPETRFICRKGMKALLIGQM